MTVKWDLIPYALHATRVPRTLGDSGAAEDHFFSLARSFPFSRVSKVASEFCRVPPGSNTHPSFDPSPQGFTPLLLSPVHPRAM